MFFCFVCGRKYGLFSNLVKHFNREHGNKCPVCGKAVKSLAKHSYRYEDLLHKIIYGLITRYGKDMNEKRKHCRELAYNLLKID